VTAKPKDKMTAAAPTREARRALGFCLTNWATWFEIDGSGYARKDGYRRKGGLEFVRLFVSAGGTKSTESSQFLQLLAVLRAISPERYHGNVGMYFALVGLTATLQRCFRGWLLDEALRPLSETGMALRLFVDVATMRQAVKDLLAAGLLQRQPLPEFDPGADDAPQDGNDKVQECTDGDKAKPKKPRKNKGAKASSGDLRKSAKKCESLQEVETELATGNFEERNTTGQLAKAHAAREPEGQGNGEASATPAPAPPEAPRSNRRPPEVTQGAGRHFPQDGERQPAITPPPRVHPECRHSSPPGERSRTITTPDGPDGPRILPLRQAGGAASVGSLLPRAVDRLANGYAVRAPDFAREIFALLKAPFLDESREGVRELANYAAGLLEAIDAGLSPGQIDELMQKALADAARIGSHRKRFYANGGSPEQYWRFLWNKHLAARRGLPATEPKVGAG